MNSIRYKHSILLLVVGLHLVIATLEANDSIEAESSATAETEKVIKKIKTPSGKKIIRKIRVLEPNSYKEAEPSHSPQATASNNIDVSPAIDIQVPTLSAQSQSQPNADGQPSQQQQTQPLINSNNNVASPTQQQADPAPQDLKSPNTKIRQIEYKPRKKLSKEGQYVDLPEDDEGNRNKQIVDLDTPGSIETPGLPGVSVLEPNANNQIVPYRVPNELKHLPEPNRAQNPENTQTNMPNQGPINQLNNLSQPQIIQNQVSPQITPDQYERYGINPNMTPSNPWLSHRLLMAQLNSPADVRAEMLNNKSVNMANMGNSHNTYINAPTHNPSNLINMPQPPVDQQARSILAQDEMLPKPKRGGRRKKNKSASDSGDMSGHQEPRVVVPPIFIQYNQVPSQQQPQQPPQQLQIQQPPQQLQIQQPPQQFQIQQPIVTTSAPIIVSKANPIYVTSPYSVQSISNPIVSSSSEPLLMAPSAILQNQEIAPIVPTSVPQQINYLNAYWSQYSGLHPSTMLPPPLSPYMRYFYPSMPYPPAPYPMARGISDYLAQLRYGNSQSNYNPYAALARSMMPPLQYPSYPYPYSPYPVPIPVPHYLRQHDKPEHPNVLSRREPLDFSANRTDYVRNAPAGDEEPKVEEVVEDENREIQYVERQRTVPIDYEEEKSENQKVDPDEEETPEEEPAGEQTEEQTEEDGEREKNEVEWTTIRVPKVKKSMVKSKAAQGEAPQQRFKTITERVPVSSTITKTSSVLPDAKSRR